MKNAPVSNARWALLLLASLMILSALVFIDQRLLPKVKPTGTPVAAIISTRLPIMLTGQAAYINSTKFGAHTAFKLNFPATWQVIDLDATHLKQVLGKLKAASPAPPVLEAIETLLTAIDPDSTALVALLLDEQATRQAALPPNVTLVIVPRHGLSLARYLDDVGATLRRQPGIAIQESKLDNTLRTTGLPVAVLHYTLAVNLTPGARTALDGYQIAAFDAHATNIIVFTFTTPSPRYTELLPVFQEIVRSAQLN